jgi:hypothetical protein
MLVGSIVVDVEFPAGDYIEVQLFDYMKTAFGVEIRDLAVVVERRWEGIDGLVSGYHSVQVVVLDTEP